MALRVVANYAMMRSTLRLAGLSLVFALIGGAVGFLSLPDHPPQGAVMPPVRVQGHPVDMTGDPHATALAIARQWLRERITLTAEGHSVTLTREGFGARVDVALLTHLLTSAGDPNSPMVRHHAALARGPIDLPLPVRVEGAVALPLLTQLKEEVDHPPVDARIDPDARQVIPERQGAFVDVYGTLARMDEAFTAGRARIDAVVDRTMPTLASAQLRDVEMDAVIGWFQTNYNADEAHHDRTYNLHLAASRLHGYVWMPGAVLDFNQIVGDRSEANGFKMATVISAGELIDGVGGGTCQIAGTLFAASFFAGMEVLDRTPHSRPSGYIKMGLDATVVYPSINLRMRNNLPFPVVIRRRLMNGLARIELLGARRERSVTFIRKIMPRVDRFEEREIPDANLPVGARVLTQRGIPGFHVTRYRILREGDQAVRERWTDQYPPAAQIWHVGTGGTPGGPLPRQDDHPEYTADQYLALTQPIDSDNMQEVRRPGFCGAPGWMVRQGLTRELPTMVTDAMAQSAAQMRALHQTGAAPAPPARPAAPVRPAAPARPAARPR